jgi:hypothetical protein
MEIAVFPTNSWTPKPYALPTKNQLVCTRITDRLFDSSFPDQQSVANTDYCRRMSVGNDVLCCSVSPREGAPMYFFILLSLFRTYTHGESRLRPFGTYTRSSGHYHTIEGVPELLVRVRCRVRARV